MPTSGGNRAQRPLIVRLSVLAASSLALGASWIGVVRADQVVDAGPVPAAVQQLLAPTADAASELIPAPAAMRQVVIVRQLRAS